MKNFVIEFGLRRASPEDLAEVDRRVASPNDTLGPDKVVLMQSLDSLNYTVFHSP